MKNLKPSVSLIFLAFILFFSASNTFAENHNELEGERDIPSLYSNP